MTKFFTSNDTIRSLVGAVAATLIGGTVLMGALGPSIVPAATQNSVNFTANSNIVRSA